MWAKSGAFAADNFDVSAIAIAPQSDEWSGSESARENPRKPGGAVGGARSPEMSSSGGADMRSVLRRRVSGPKTSGV
ncbi:hypothetical protein [Lyngbya sp. CCY1209]|uniref:hypothetical protein n=1 Tax=Lyngbya sp. CCY1209 TaxID=2886103 RepID=UPI002D1FE4DF|nr:hypothetical protein [Lyngbya sp. CCY1209]MEB3886446.1 hypothetical protein [Lyngbya sp. CCY1209]